MNGIGAFLNEVEYSFKPALMVGISTVARGIQPESA